MIKYEVCCGCFEDVINAEQGGAHRVELNSSLFLGGLTPSLATLSLAKKNTKIEIMSMVRPRECGFYYSDYDFEVMKEDAKLLINMGTDGIVFGFLNQDGNIDFKRTQEFLKICEGKQTVFSRAIDLCADLVESAKGLESLGLTRILTSGGKPNAILGMETIKKMQESLNGTCEILPGGGITPQNVKKLINYTGVTQVHSSARSVRFDKSASNNKEIFFGGNIDGKYLSEEIYKVTDPNLVKEMLNSILEA